MAGLNVTQFKQLICKPALERISLYSESALNLVTGTALAESGLTYLRQIQAGPALGVFQMEPATYFDIYQNFLKFRPDLLRKVQEISGISSAHPENMVFNLHYASVMCRLNYLRAKDALPDAQDAQALSAYHKVHYNTQKGKADSLRNIPYFEEAIHA